jgi:hypothetical protein
VLFVVEEEGDFAVEHDPGFVLAGVPVHRRRRAPGEELFGKADEGAKAGDVGGDL